MAIKRANYLLTLEDCDEPDQMCRKSTSLSYQIQLHAVLHTIIACRNLVSDCGRTNGMLLNH